MKRIYLIFIGIAILIIGWFSIRFFIGGSENSWIKDEKGAWIKHGSPSQTPVYIIEQQNAINCASDLYQGFTILTVVISSQCLGTCEN